MTQYCNCGRKLEKIDCKTYPDKQNVEPSLLTAKHRKCQCGEEHTYLRYYDGYHPKHGKFLDCNRKGNCTEVGKGVCDTCKHNNNLKVNHYKRNY